jgi:hypothetical protein
MGRGLRRRLGRSLSDGHGNYDFLLRKMCARLRKQGDKRLADFTGSHPLPLKLEFIVAAEEE